MTDLRPTERFSSRVAHYVRARPKYPPALLEFFIHNLGLLPVHRLADIGSGTGILSELLLRNGNVVVGVEPNAEMRSAGELFLRAYPKFQSVNATAEATTLGDASADFIFAGQAFHWFDRVKTRAEFHRILKPGGWVVLVWNERRDVGQGFDAGYDEIVKQFSIDAHVDHHTTVTGSADAILGKFFGLGHFQVREFPNFQEMNLDDVKARLLSSSYMPTEDHPMFNAMMAAAEKAFAAHALNGSVRLSYDTRAYYGKMT